MEQSPDYRQDFYLDNKLLFQSETEIPAFKGLNIYGVGDYSFFANIMIEDLDPENKKKVTIDFAEFNSFEGDVISFLNSKGITEWFPGALDKIKIIDIPLNPT